MIKELLYFIHLLGMTAIIFSSGMLSFMSSQEARKRKLSVFMLGGIHLQFLIGVTLFLINLSSVNHAKIGVKIILALFLIVLGTLHHKKIKIENSQTRNTSRIIFIIAIIITLIAFLW